MLLAAQMPVRERKEEAPERILPERLSLLRHRPNNYAQKPVAGGFGKLMDAPSKAPLPLSSWRNDYAKDKV